MLFIKIVKTLLWTLVGAVLVTYASLTSAPLLDGQLPGLTGLWLSAGIWACLYIVIGIYFLEDIWLPDVDFDDTSSVCWDFFDGINDFEDWLDNRDMDSTSRAYVKALLEEYYKDVEDQHSPDAK